MGASAAAPSSTTPRHLVALAALALLVRAPPGSGTRVVRAADPRRPPAVRALAPSSAARRRRGEDGRAASGEARAGRDTENDSEGEAEETAGSGVAGDAPSRDDPAESGPGPGPGPGPSPSEDGEAPETAEPPAPEHERGASQDRAAEDEAARSGEKPVEGAPEDGGDAARPRGSARGRAAAPGSGASGSGNAAVRGDGTGRTEGPAPGEEGDGARRAVDADPRHAAYARTDAYKNTLREFARLDAAAGKEEGHHWRQYREARREAAARSDAHDGGGGAVARRDGEEVGGGARGGGDPEARRAPPRPERGTRSAERSAEEGEREPPDPDATAGSRGGREREAAAREAGDVPTGPGRPGRPHRGPAPVAGAHDATAGSRSGKERQEDAQDEMEPGEEEPREAGELPNGPSRPGRPYSGPVSMAGAHAPGGRDGVPPRPRTDLPAGPFADDPEKAKRFQEYLAKRARAMKTRQTLRHPINTLLWDGRAEEAPKNAGSVHAKTASRNNYKAQYHPHASAASGPRGPDLRPAAPPPKVLQKIPLVRHAFKRTKGEETLNDAALSFTRGLLMGVFKADAALDYKRKAALLDWCDLLSVSLPPEIGLHELLDTLKHNIDTISLRHENLRATILAADPLPDRRWSASCRKGLDAGGFFCGFWKLLHVASAGFAEQAGGLALREASPAIRVFSAAEAAAVVREYMALFFNCEKCSRRFVAMFDDCSFERCRRLSAETTDASPESWKEFPLWMWQVHNDVSRSKLERASEKYEKEGNRVQAKHWAKSLAAIFPNIDECIVCVTMEGTWNLDEVYKYLEAEYWTFGIEVDPKMEAFLKYNERERDHVSHGFGTYLLMTLLALSTLLLKRRQMRATGRHKKDDSEPFPKFPNKYRDS